MLKILSFCFFLVSFSICVPYVLICRNRNLFASMYIKLSLEKYAGIPCKIPYGQGSIFGFFSQDNVQVRDIIIKDQVCILPSIIFQSELWLNFICFFGFTASLLLPILMEFVEITREGSLALAALPFDGILGLGFQDTSVRKVTPVWYTPELH